MKKRKFHKEIVCAQCGNEIPNLPHKNLIHCQWCNYWNTKEDICLNNYGKRSKNGATKE